MMRVAMTLAALLVASLAEATQCDLSPIRFTAEERARTLATLLSSGEKDSREGDYPVGEMEIAFEPPRWQAWADGEVVPLVLSATIDATALSTRWEAAAKDRAKARGCRQRKRWAKDFERSISDSRDFTGKFRVKYVDWSCGKKPFGGWWYNKNFEVDATIWQTFMPRIKDSGRRLEIGFKGRYKDNVHPKLKDLARFFVKFSSVAGIFDRGLAHVGKNLSARLDEYQKMTDAVERFRVLDSRRAELIPISPDGGEPRSWLNLVFADARFRRSGNRLPLHLTMRSTQGKEMLVSQVCELQQSIRQAKSQGERVGPEGKEYAVAKGDSLWKIAESFYGDGRYLQLITAANDLGDGAVLQEGDRLRVEPLAFFYRNKEVALVHRGESLWRISGGGESFGKILRANRDRLKDPNRVYPLQVLRTAMGGEEGKAGLTLAPAPASGSR